MNKLLGFGQTFMRRSLSVSAFFSVSELLLADLTVDASASNPFWYSSQSGMLEGAELMSAVIISYFAPYSLYMKNRFICKSSQPSKEELSAQTHPLAEHPSYVCCNLGISLETRTSV